MKLAKFAPLLFSIQIQHIVNANNPNRNNCASVEIMLASALETDLDIFYSHHIYAVAIFGLCIADIPYKDKTPVLNNNVMNLATCGKFSCHQMTLK